MKGAVVVKRKLIPGLLFFVLIFCSYFSSEEYIPSSFVHQPCLFEADTILLDFDNKLKDNDIEGAVKVIQDGIDKSSNLVIKKKNYEFVSARGVLTGKVLKSGEEVLKTYRMLFDPRAEELYKKAVVSADKEALKELLLSYGAGSFAEKARETLADLYLAEGNFTNALSYLNSCSEVTPLLLLKKAACFTGLAKTKEANDIYTEVINKYPEGVIEAAGVSVKAAAFASERIRKIETEEVLPEMPFKSGEVSIKWKTLDLAENPFERSEPVESGSNVYILTGNMLYSLNKEWGLMDWKLDLGYGTGQAFYPAVLGPGLAVSQFIMAAKYSIPGAAYGIFEPKKGEILVSSVKGEQLSSEKIKFTSSFNLPAVEGEDVYFGFISKKDSLSQYYLAKAVRGRKELKWAVNLGGGSQEQYMFVNAPALVIAGDEIFAETNLFTVASLDKNSGNINWIYGVLPETGMVNDNVFFESAPPYRNLLVNGEAVFYAPKYKKVIICLSRKNGEKLWEVARESYENLIYEAGDYLYTADSYGVNRLAKKDGKRVNLFKTEGTGRTGKITCFNGLFYFPAGKGFCIADLSGKLSKLFRLEHKITELYPVEDGVYLIYNGQLAFCQDKESCLRGSQKAVPEDPFYINAVVCRITALDKDGRYIAGLEELAKLATELPAGNKKEEIRNALEEFALRAARSFYEAGEYAGCKELLEKSFGPDNLRTGSKTAHVDTAWLLMNSYEKTADPKLAEYYSKAAEELKGEYFEPEQNLEIAADYYFRVKKERLKELFFKLPETPVKELTVNTAPFWKAVIRNTSSAFVPVAFGNRIYFANESVVSIFDLDTGKGIKENLFFKSRLAQVSYGSYGVFPKAIAGDGREIYFCGPDFNIFGLDTNTLAFNFEWKPVKKVTPTFLPYKIEVTGNLLVVYNPNKGIFALDRKNRQRVYEIAGEYQLPLFLKDAVYTVEKNTMILHCFDATTGFKRWSTELQSGLRNLELLADNAYLYIITEEGVIYKVTQGNGTILTAKRCGGSKATWDFFPSGISEENIYLNTGRNLVCVDKSTLEIKWNRDTYVTYKAEVKKGSGKGAATTAKLNEVEKPAELQRNISKIYALGGKLLVSAGEFIEIYDAESSKAELWGDKAIRLGNSGSYPATFFPYGDKMILVRGQMMNCYTTQGKKKK